MPGLLQVRRDLLLGRLLLQATEGAGPHAAHALGANLLEAGLLPRWVYATLTQHPELFGRAFQRMFQPEAERWGDSRTDEPVARFWRRPGGGAAASGAAPSKPDLPSRFLSDFQVTADERCEVK